MRQILRWGGKLMFVGAVAGCGSNPIGPQDVVGTYRATIFTVDYNGTLRDVLAMGGQVSIVLNSDGTTTGTFVTPAVSGLSTTPINESLAGTYALHGSDRVKFTHAASTLVGDLFFVFHPNSNELTGGYSFSPPNVGLVVLTLTRQ